MRIPLLGVHIVTDHTLDVLLGCAQDLADIRVDRLATENQRLIRLVGQLRQAVSASDMALVTAVELCGAEVVLAALQAIEEAR